MKKLLFVSLFLILITAILSLYRFGFTFDGFMQGDGSAILAAASSLIGIWALVIGFSITAIGATFQLSKLPPSWKLRLFHQKIFYTISPFFLQALVVGVIPFWALFNIEINVRASESSVTIWLLLDFILQIMLIISAALAAKSTYEDLTIIRAIEFTLNKIDLKKIEGIKKSHKDAFKNDYEEGNRLALIPMTPYGRSLKGKGSKYHDELLTLLLTLFSENDPQILDSGIRIISQWAKNKNFRELDSYFQYRLLPELTHILTTDQKFFLPIVFKSRLYYLAHLLTILQKSGANLTFANAANLIWELIEEYSKSIGMMTSALDQSEISLSLILKENIKKEDIDSILLLNLTKSISSLVAEDSPKSLSWIDKIIEWHRFSLMAAIKFWAKRRSMIPKIGERIKYIYQCVDKGYKDKPALLFNELHDIRYWILVGLRRTQELLVNTLVPGSLEAKLRKNAAADFDYFEGLINDLLSIRLPEGDEKGFEKIKYPINPYVV